MKSIVKRFVKSKIVLVLAFALMMTAQFGFSPAGAVSCPTNDILPCGATSPADFIEQVREEVKPDLQKIYANSRYKLPESEYSRFAREAVVGKIDGDGNLIVDGKIIGTNSKSIGRNEKSKSWPITIGNTTYHQSYDRDLIQNYMNAMVLFDENGAIQTVIIRECGNPVTVTPVEKEKPTYTCDLLDHDQVDRDTYRFSTDASASGGAKVHHVEYSFGDGSAIVKRNNPSELVTHTYKKAGTFKAKVTVYVELPSGSLRSITPAGDCVAPITIESAEKPSIEIVKKVENSHTATVRVNEKYRYQISVTNTGTVDLHDVVLTDTPDNGIVLTEADAGKINFNVWRHTIATLGEGETRYFTLHAKVPSYRSSTLNNTVCANTPDIAGTKDACDDATVDALKPGSGGTKPKEDDTPVVVTKVKDEEPQVLADTTTKPKVLPSTGPFDAAMGIAGIGSLAGAGYYWRSSRRSIVDKMLSR